MLRFIASSTAFLCAAASGTPEGAATTTRYWDCCKPSCAWEGNAGAVTNPVATCDINDNPLGSEVTNVCAGGGADGVAYMCTDQQPFEINEEYAYGFAAANVDCSVCYEMTFTSSSLASSNKKMIVQVTNKGEDLGDLHFDLQLPGGGFGIFNGCAGDAPNGPGQFDEPEENWGERYGGISSLAECAGLPAKLRSGCEFRFGWFENADNPAANARRVQCPAELVAITGSQRDDDSDYELVTFGPPSPPTPQPPTPPPTPAPTTDCVFTDCDCDWANAGTCGGDGDGMKCNTECCCPFRTTSVPPVPAPESSPESTPVPPAPTSLSTPTPDVPPESTPVQPTPSTPAPESPPKSPTPAADSGVSTSAPSTTAAALTTGEPNTAQPTTAAPTPAPGSDGGLSGGAVAAIVTCSVVAVGLAVGVGYFCTQKAPTADVSANEPVQVGKELDEVA